MELSDIRLVLYISAYPIICYQFVELFLDMILMLRLNLPSQRLAQGKENITTFMIIEMVRGDEFGFIFTSLATMRGTLVPMETRTAEPA